MHGGGDRQSPTHAKTQHRYFGRILFQKLHGAAQVYVIRVSAYCDLDDQEKAASALRKLAKRPRLRRNAIAYCAKRGISLE